MNKHFRQNRGAGESLLDMPPLRRVLMVGAVTDPSGELSRTDRALLDFGLDPLRKTGLPVASDGGIEVEVMNKADAFGRRDFLSEEGVEADIVILCNIPHKSDEDEYASSYSAIKSSLRNDIIDERPSAPDRSAAIRVFMRKLLRPNLPERLFAALTLAC